MALDPDIQQMKKIDVVAQLRQLKQAGVKVNISGGLEVQKQSLQNARREAPAAVASGSNTDNQPKGADLSNTLVPHTDVHPSVKKCLDILTDEFFGGDTGNLIFCGLEDCIPYNSPQHAHFVWHLYPATCLVNSFVSCVQKMRETGLGSNSPENLLVLSGHMRTDIPTMAIHENLRKLFEIFCFQFDIPKGPSKEDSLSEPPGAATMQASGNNSGGLRQMHTGSSCMTNLLALRQYRAGVHEALLPSSQSGHEEADRSIRQLISREEIPKSLSASESEYLTRQVTIVRRAVLKSFGQWFKTFAVPQRRVWPINFDREEKIALKAHIRKWARDPTNRINLASYPHSKQKET